MDVLFENAEVSDIDRLFELNKKLIAEYETDKSLDLVKVYAWVKRKLESNVKNYKCIYFNGMKAGYFHLYDHDEKLELDDLFIFDEFQGKGIGTKVLEYAAKAAGERNKEIYLYVFTENKGAVNLYLRNGYRITENVGTSRYIMSLKI